MNSKAGAHKYCTIHAMPIISPRFGFGFRFLPDEKVCMYDRYLAEQRHHGDHSVPNIDKNQARHLS